jgi:drug/metabolite transporter (DMT)-like permease
MVAVSNFFSKIPGQIYLWLAVIIFASASSVTRKLTEIGSQNSIDGRNPISFCNVLFVGNICALLGLILIYRHQLIWRSFRQFSVRDWSSMTAVAILAGAIAPAFIFVALSQTMVNNVVLIGRIEIPLTLVLSVWLLRERTHRWEIVGALVSFVGVVITVAFQSTGGSAIARAGFGIGQGELLAAIAAIALAVSNLISKVRLTRIPVGIFTIVRTALGTIIFFFAALVLYGRSHFDVIFSPFLWKWMLVYGAIIVAVGQSFWLTGLKKTSGTEASLAGALNPIAAILAAYLILGEVPTSAQYLGGGIILSGIVLSEIGSCRQPPSTDKSSYPQKMETKVGFKGI